MPGENSSVKGITIGDDDNCLRVMLLLVPEDLKAIYWPPPGPTHPRHKIFFKSLPTTGHRFLFPSTLSAAWHAHLPLETVTLCQQLRHAGLLLLQGCLELAHRLPLRCKHRLLVDALLHQGAALLLAEFLRAGGRGT